jgi:hypothetical protein
METGPNDRATLSRQQKGHLLAFCESPLTDSNRRPPPNHEVAPRCYVVLERRLVMRFPCSSIGFSACSTLSSKDPEPPRKSPNLSPEPVPNGVRACRRPWQPASDAPEAIRASVVRSGGWRIGQARLAPGADGVGEARRACFGECAQELVEWPGWVEVGGLLHDCGPDGLWVEVVEVEQELVGVDRLDRSPTALR